MIGALIGDLAASTWEQDKTLFYSDLVRSSSQPSIYGLTLMKAASLNIESIHNVPSVKMAETDLFCYVGQWMMWNIVSAWMDKDVVYDFNVSAIIDKAEMYARIFLIKLIKELRNGSSKSEAFHHVSGFENLIQGGQWKSDLGKEHGYGYILVYLFRAWDAFYRGFDFTSCIHNAMQWPGDKHLLGILTGAFADAMYGCRFIMLKKKYTGHIHGSKVINLPEAQTQHGIDKSLLDEMSSISYNHRTFYSKNNALTNVEWHKWMTVKNIFEEVSFNDEEHRKIMKSAPTHLDCRYGFYLDDGWHYIYRSYALIARFQMKEDDGEWRITSWQLSGERSYKDSIMAFDCALYEGCKIVNQRIIELCRYTKSCKYFNGEIDVPEKWKDTIQGKFWYGEMMFMTSLSDFKPWEDMVATWLKDLKGEKKASFEKYNDQQRVMICYIETLFTKWCPYDNMDWIFEY